MSEEPTARHVRHNLPSDEEEEEEEQVVVPTTRAARHNRASDDDEEEEDAQDVAGAVAAEAPPVLSPPKAEAPILSAPTVAGAPSAEPARPTATRTSAPSTAGIKAAEEVFKKDFNAVTYDALLEILKSVTLEQVEYVKLQVEQERQAVEQEKQTKRIELFHDVLPNAAAAARTESNGVSTSASARDLTEEQMTSGEYGYRYSDMLTMLFESLHRDGLGAVAERNRLIGPDIERSGKKTIIRNFARICQSMNRPVEEVKDFIEKELSTHGNLDASSALILKYKVQKSSDLERILTLFTDTYVKCDACHKIDTELTKEGRRLVLKCNRCGATRTVKAATTALFTAQTEKRARLRANAT